MTLETPKDPEEAAIVATLLQELREEVKRIKGWRNEIYGMVNRCSEAQVDLEDRFTAIIEDLSARFETHEHE